MKKTNLFILAAAIALVVVGLVGLNSENINAQNAAPSKENKKGEEKVGINVGDIAPDISYNSPDGKPISLSSLRGKMVLLDFWASWCRPCRFENPNVVAAYNEYKDKKFNNAKGFTVLGVSLDSDKNAWMNAINQDKLTWNHISDLMQWQSAPARLYQVQGIPMNFLIDGKGKIIATNLRGKALEDELNKHLSKK